MFEELLKVRAATIQEQNSQPLATEMFGAGKYSALFIFSEIVKKKDSNNYRVRNAIKLTIPWWKILKSLLRLVFKDHFSARNNCYNKI